MQHHSDDPFLLPADKGSVSSILELRVIRERSQDLGRESVKDDAIVAIKSSRLPVDDDVRPFIFESRELLSNEGTEMMAVRWAP